MFTTLYDAELWHERKSCDHGFWAFEDGGKRYMRQWFTGIVGRRELSVGRKLGTTWALLPGVGASRAGAINLLRVVSKLGATIIGLHGRARDRRLDAGGLARPPMRPPGRAASQYEGGGCSASSMRKSMRAISVTTIAVFCSSEPTRKVSCSIAFRIRSSLPSMRLKRSRLMSRTLSSAMS